MRKKYIFLPLVLLGGLVLTGCNASNLQDNFTEADQVVETPWSDYVLPATGIEFAAGEDNLSLVKGEKHTYQYSIQPRGATSNSLNWFSDDVNVATVENGVVTAVGGGDATITASSPDNAFNPMDLKVNVKVPLIDFALNVNPTVLDWDEEYQYIVSYDPEDTTERNIVYEIVEASEEGLVSVNEQGIVKTANKNGTAKLKASIGEISHTYNLTIQTVAVESVTIANADNIHELEVNHSLQLTASVLPNTATELNKRGVKFYSRQPDIAKVDELTGVVQGVSAGNAQIYAKCGEVESANYAVEVFKVNAVAVTITTPDFVLSNNNDNGLNKQIEYTLTTDRAGYANPSKATIKFVSDDESVATVDDNGLVTAKNPGNANISVQISQEGLALVEDSVAVTVDIVSKVLTINGGNSFFNDSTLTLSAALTPAKVSNDEITWSLEQDPAIVSLSATTGASVTLTPLNNEVVGTVKVKAVNTGGASSEITVTLSERPGTFTAAHHYIVGSALYNTGESVRVDGKSSWTSAKYAYHFTYEVNDPSVYQQYKGTIKFQAGDQFKYFVGTDYWVPVWEQQEGWAERGYHIQIDGANNAFALGQMRFVKENENHEYVVSDDADANVEVVEAGYYDLYAKLYNDNDSNWYALYIQKVPALNVEIADITMGTDESYQIKAHDWIGQVTYTIKSGEDYITLSENGLVTAKGPEGVAVVTVNDDRNVPVDVTFTLQDGVQATKVVYLNANGKFDTGDIVPFVHSWGGENTTPAADVKMSKVDGQNIVYSASIPSDHTMIDFVRCPEGSTELVWEQVYNQSKDQNIPTDGKDMFTMTGWSDEKDTRNYEYVEGEWSTFDSSITYEPTTPEVDPHGDSYLMYGNNPTWNYLALSENPGNTNEMMCSLDLEANVEFVIKMGEDDWRHFENNKDASADEVVEGSASGADHNFKASVAGTYTFYIAKDKTADGGKNVYIGYTGPVVPPQTYTVSFDANGGSGSKAAIEDVSGAYTLPDATGFTAPADKQFAGWALTASGAVITTATIDVTADVTLYAIWESIPAPNNVTLYLTANWGGWESPKAYVYDSATDTPKAAWPGEAMSYVGVNDDNDTIFSYTVNINAYDRIIFHNGNGGDNNQTVSIDISAATDKDAYYLSGRVDNNDANNIFVTKWGTFSDAALTDKQVVYFTNNKEWNNVKFYVFNSGTDAHPNDWPGVAAKWVFKNGDNQDVYRLVIDATAWDAFIFNGDGAQTVNILLSSLTGTNNAFYVGDTQDGSGNWNVGQWQHNPLA